MATVQSVYLMGQDRQVVQVPANRLDAVLQRYAMGVLGAEKHDGRWIHYVYQKALPSQIRKYEVIQQGPGGIMSREYSIFNALTKAFNTEKKTGSSVQLSIASAYLIASDQEHYNFFILDQHLAQEGIYPTVPDCGLTSEQQAFFFLHPIAQEEQGRAISFKDYLNNIFQQGGQAKDVLEGSIRLGKAQTLTQTLRESADRFNRLFLQTGQINQFSYSLAGDPPLISSIYQYYIQCIQFCLAIPVPPQELLPFPEELSGVRIGTPNLPLDNEPVEQKLKRALEMIIRSEGNEETCTRLFHTAEMKKILPLLSRVILIDLINRDFDPNLKVEQDRYLPVYERIPRKKEAIWKSALKILNSVVSIQELVPYSRLPEIRDRLLHHTSLQQGQIYVYDMTSLKEFFANLDTKDHDLFFKLLFPDRHHFSSIVQDHRDLIGLLQCIHLSGQQILLNLLKHPDPTQRLVQNERELANVLRVPSLYWETLLQAFMGQDTRRQNPNAPKPLSICLAEMSPDQFAMMAPQLAPYLPVQDMNSLLTFMALLKPELVRPFIQAFPQVFTKYIRNTATLITVLQHLTSESQQQALLELFTAKDLWNILACEMAEDTIGRRLYSIFTTLNQQRTQDTFFQLIAPCLPEMFESGDQLGNFFRQFSSNYENLDYFLNPSSKGSKILRLMLNDGEKFVAAFAVFPHKPLIDLVQSEDLDPSNCAHIQDHLAHILKNLTAEEQSAFLTKFGETIESGIEDSTNFGVILSKLHNPRIIIGRENIPYDITKEIFNKVVRSLDDFDCFLRNTAFDEARLVSLIRFLLPYEFLSENSKSAVQFRKTLKLLPAPCQLEWINRLDPHEMHQCLRSRKDIRAEAALIETLHVLSKENWIPFLEKIGENPRVILGDNISITNMSSNQYSYGIAELLDLLIDGEILELNVKLRNLFQFLIKSYKDFSFILNYLHPGFSYVEGRTQLAAFQKNMRPNEEVILCVKTGTSPFFKLELVSQGRCKTLRLSQSEIDMWKKYDIRSGSRLALEYSAQIRSLTGKEDEVVNKLIRLIKKLQKMEHFSTIISNPQEIACVWGKISQAFKKIPQELFDFFRDLLGRESNIIEMMKALSNQDMSTGKLTVSFLEQLKLQKISSLQILTDLFTVLVGIGEQGRAIEAFLSSCGRSLEIIRDKKALFQLLKILKNRTSAQFLEILNNLHITLFQFDTGTSTATVFGEPLNDEEFEQLLASFSRNGQKITESGLKLRDVIVAAFILKILATYKTPRWSNQAKRAQKEGMLQVLIDSIREQIVNPLKIVSIRSIFNALIDAQSADDFLGGRGRIRAKLYDVLNRAIAAIPKDHSSSVMPEPYTSIQLVPQIQNKLGKVKLEDQSLYQTLLECVQTKTLPSDELSKKIPLNELRAVRSFVQQVISSRGVTDPTSLPPNEIRVPGRRASDVISESYWHPRSLASVSFHGSYIESRTASAARIEELSDTSPRGSGIPAPIGAAESTQ